MNIQDFALIQALYEHKNISRAAEALFMAQPTVSKRLQIIEEEFGTVLAHRGKHGVEFTPEGEYLAVKAAQINSLIQETRQHLEQMNREPIQKLVIGASNATIHTYFPELLMEFETRFPKIQIELVNEKSSQLTKLLEQGKLDVGFVTGELVFSGERLRLQQEQAYVVSAVPLELDNLPAIPYLAYDIDPGSGGILHKWWGEHFAQPFPSGLHVSGMEVAGDLIRRGLGYTFTFRVDGGKYEYIYPLSNRDGTPLIRDNWCLYHDAHLSRSPELGTFLEFVKKRYGRI